MARDELIAKIAGLSRLDFDHFDDTEGDVCVTEMSKDGAGTVRFLNGKHTLGFGRGKPFPHAAWVNQKRCADGAFVELREQEVVLNIVELKSKLTRAEWSKAKNQFAGMLLNVLAVLGVSQITLPIKVRLFVAFKEEAVSATQTTALLANKRLLGGGEIIPDEDDWNSGVVSLLGSVEGELIKLLRDDQGNAVHDLA